VENTRSHRKLILNIHQKDSSAEGILFEADDSTAIWLFGNVTLVKRLSKSGISLSFLRSPSCIRMAHQFLRLQRQHNKIRTTMNIYGKAMEKSKREAHGKVVRLVLASQVA